MVSPHMLFAHPSHMDLNSDMNLQGIMVRTNGVFKNDQSESVSLHIKNVLVLCNLSISQLGHLI